MLTFRELRLDDGWDAEPNAPDPQVAVAGSTVAVRFRLTRPRRSTNRTSGILGALGRLLGAGRADEGRADGGWGTLRFLRCSRWRWDATNDHEWYKADGQGRYAGVAPAWGRFYELVGEDPVRDAVPWQAVEAETGAARHFLFYFRDETLEFMAQDWAFERDGAG
jgi:hypothetical protein